MFRLCSDEEAFIVLCVFYSRKILFRFVKMLRFILLMFKKMRVLGWRHFYSRFQTVKKKKNSNNRVKRLSIDMDLVLFYF